MTLPILHLIQTRDGLMLAPRYDRYVGGSLDVYGEYSPDERDLLCGLVSPGDIVCQVGANIGALTVPLAKRVGPTGKVLALEPQAVLFRTLTANLAMAEAWHVEALRAAAGAKDGVAAMPDVDYTRPGNFGGLSLSSEPTSQRVPLVTLDRALADVPRLKLLHIDVEGAELDVLAGAAQVIKRHRPLVYLEIDRPAVRDGIADALALHDLIGYVHMPTLYRADNWRGQARDIWVDENGVQIASHNLLAIPAELLAQYHHVTSALPPLSSLRLDTIVQED